MTPMKYVIVLYFIFAKSHAEKRYNQPIVTVKEGKLRGTVTRSAQNFMYYSFKGIPYATPPVGNLRFKEPLPPKPWKGIRDASQHGSKCTQVDGTFMGSEDCLFVNVYTRSLMPHAQIPVMVFVHGGSFFSGSGDSDVYGPDFLIQHHVILVTMNYRLDLLGFLCLNTSDAPGNFGLKDQVAALKWVQDNIDQFGGDPNRVTLFGESAGSASVTYHMLSPMSKGLFHKIIAESATCINDFAIAKEPVQRAFRAGQVLGKYTNNVHKLFRFLRKEDAESLTNLTSQTLTFDEMFRGVSARFVPAVETKFKNTETFIDENPLSLLVQGKLNVVPIMIGYNSGEGIALVSEIIKKIYVYNKEPSFFVQSEIVDRVSYEKLEEFGERVKKFYIGNRSLTSYDRSIVADILTDVCFSYNIHRFAYLYSSYDTVYFYKFNYDTPLNTYKESYGNTDLKGAAHADELSYLFSNNQTKELYKSNNLRDIVDSVTKLWTNFAKTGSPTPYNNSEVYWPPYTKKGKEFLNIGDEMTVGNYADRTRIEFWNQIYSEAFAPHIRSDS